MAAAQRLSVVSAAPSAPFPCVEDAWFWTVGAMRARHGGSDSSDPQRISRPCDPDDIVKCLDRLYRRRRINLDHARVLRKWGEQQMTPHSARSVGSDAVLWREAMDCLGPILRLKGIVG
jgi:hypothetical protein